MNARDNRGNTPLHRLCSQETNLSASGLQMLLEAGADVAATDELGRTPLHRAVTLSTVRLLIEYGADVNATNSNGSSPLCSFLRRSGPKNAVAVIKIFFAAGVHVSCTDVVGTDPLALVIARWAEWAQNREAGVMERILSQFLIAASSFDGEFVRSGVKKTVWQLARGVDCVRFLLMVGKTLTRHDFASLQSKNDKIVLLPVTVVYPNAIEWIDDEDDDLKVFVTDEKNIEEETKKLKVVEDRWKENVYHSCAKRVIGLAMVFVHLPTLIVYEICCHEQKCLKVVERFKVWQLIESVRKCLK